MNTNQASGRWNQLKGRAKKAWGELTDNDKTKAEGTMNKLQGAIRESVGNAEEKTENILEELHNGRVNSTQKALTAARTKTTAARDAAKAAQAERKLARQKFEEGKKATKKLLKRNEADARTGANTIGVTMSDAQPVTTARPAKKSKKGK